MERDDFETGDPTPTIDLRYYWNVVKKRRWVIASVAVMVLAGTLAITVRKPKIYQASATVIVDPHAPQVLGDSVRQVVQLGSGNVWVNSEYYNTQIEILTSRALARQVVDKHDLHKDLRLVPSPPPGLSEDQLIDHTAGILQGKIGVEPVRDSRVFAISIRDTDRTLAADLANHVMRVYISQNLSTKRTVTRDATGEIAKQLDEARAELIKAEDKLVAFRENNNLLSVSLEDRQNMLSKNLQSYNDVLTTTQQRRIDAQARRASLEQIIQQDALHAPPTNLTQYPGIEKLRETYLDERRKLSAYEKRYGEKHPDVIAQHVRVNTALKDLQTEVSGALKSLDGEIRALQVSEKKYRAEVDRLTQEAFELSKREVEYRRLSRDSRAAEEDYTKLLGRLSEVSQQEQVNDNNIRPLDEARVPGSPVEPNVKVAGVLGLGMGLLLGFGLAFLVEFLDRTVKSQEDIEVAAGVPFLGMVPSVDAEPRGGKGTPELYVNRHPTSTVAECCRVVRTNILFCSADRPLRTFLVTSSNPVEGKTMTVVNLGIVMAQSGHRTLMVDTDMRRPRLHKAIGASNEDGVSRLIVGESSIEKAVKTTEVPNLYLLPCGPIPPNPAELLQTEKFANLVAELAGRFDRVIFDSPPALAVTDAAVLSRVVDGAVLVARAGKTSRDALKSARRALGAVSANIIGAVLNDVNLKHPHYAGYYQYYQYRSTETPATAGAPADKA